MSVVQETAFPAEKSKTTKDKVLQNIFARVVLNY